MTNEIAKLDKAVTAISPLEPKTSRPAFLAICRNGLIVEMGEARIFEDRAPTPAERSTLEARLTRLKSFLSERDDAEAFGRLAMVLTMPSQSAEGVDAKVRGMAYREALDGVPSWAIVDACRRLLRGGYPQHKRFAPSPPEMRSLCDELTWPLHSEIRELEDILRAKVVPAPRHEKPISGKAKTWAELEAERGNRPVPGWRQPEYVADLDARRKKREAEAETAAASEADDAA